MLPTRTGDLLLVLYQSPASVPNQMTLLSGKMLVTGAGKVAMNWGIPGLSAKRIRYNFVFSENHRLFCLSIAMLVSSCIAYGAATFRCIANSALTELIPWSVPHQILPDLLRRSLV